MIYYFTVFPFKDSGFTDGLMWYGIDDSYDEVRIDLNNNTFEMMFWIRRESSYYYKINNYMDNQNYEYNFR